MKVIPPVLFALLLLFCLAACKKNNLVPVVPIVYPDYSELKVGNYWIYEEFTIDTLGNATSTGRIDSCYITKDTIINNQTYYVLAGPSPIATSTDTTYQYLRDSLDYTIDNFGNILFSSRHIGDIFSIFSNSTDTLISLMSDSGLNITVPAGSYSTISYEQEYRLAPAYWQGGNPRYRYTRYSQNIGIVSETLRFFAYIPTYTERRLVRYHLN